ncbi:Putative DWNN domain-containing protein [[Torrubiella] hemipterigena]|uniref:Putative DWNN domain-containing protein n=1 Tax=[Torrubiella] hemipterigena TaxID=1531966 RepID=A0A0A1TE93_9HYPO|nr:Putative DWNN domain-containing protein [[Torrubiella] hemipterigena]
MASSVFFKFKSQREPTRVEFDGTGISVFELKREIIIKSGLGDGTDFDLFIYTDDNSEEYDDDTTIIPRSTTVLARRQPAMKPGAGRAARYMSGKMPVAAKNAGRKEQAAKAGLGKTGTTALNQMSSAMTEEDKMAAMFAAQTEQWSVQQEELSHQAPVFKPGAKRPANVPDHEPPNGYICYRCGQKGHWIQLCPTNDDPDFDNRPRVKRTTGIPRSFLKTVDKSVVMAQTEGDESKRPAGIMVNAEGDFVIAEPDKASWERFQAKTKSSSNAKDDMATKEIQDRGLECPIDKKMLIEPTKAPCCQKTFCNDCITNALMESDFVCPICQTEGVLLDDLEPDLESAKKIQEFIKEKELEKEAAADAAKEAAQESSIVSPKPEDKSDTTDPTTATELVDKPAVVEDSQNKHSTEETTTDAVEKSEKAEGQPVEAATAPVTSPSPKSDDTSQAKAAPEAPQAISKKRAADDALENPKIPKGPRAMQNQTGQNQMNMMNGMPMNGMGMNNMMFNGMPMMPNMMGMPNMNMGMNMMGMPNMNMMGMPMMGMPGFGNMNGGFGNAMNNWGMNNMNGMGMGMPNMNMNMNNGGNNFNNNNNNGNNGNGNYNNYGGNQRPPQQSQQQGEEDDGGAYFRNPVNPQRFQSKQRRVRPSDYTEL